MLETDERDAPAAHHELARVRAAQSDHQIDIRRPVQMQHRFGSRDRFLGELHQVGGPGEREQVAPLGPQRGSDDVVGVRAVGVENVVTPIGVEDGPVGFAVLTVCGFPIVGIEHREKIRKEIDQHE